MIPVSGGHSSSPPPESLAQALLAAGVEPSLLQTAYAQHSETGVSFAEALAALGVDPALALRGSGSLGPAPGLQAGSGGALPRRLGDYELGRQLGEGGMGAVYAARHLPTGSERALKVLRVDSGPETIQRFQREAEGMAAAADHPHVVGIHAAGQAGPWLWIALDLVEGGSLADRLRQGPLPIADAERVLAGMAAGLSFAHTSGVLHRDLKPANVLLDGAGEALLVDFGLARLTWQHSLTQTGVILGTPAYMAPEQATGEGVDERADVYGLGGVLYHCLCGEPPFSAPSLMGLLDTVLTEPAPSVRALRPDAPAHLVALCAAALAKDPSERPASAAAFLEALEGRGQLPNAGPGRALVGGVLATLTAIALTLGAVFVSRGAGSKTPAPSTASSAEAVDALVARALAGETLSPAERESLQAFADTLSRRDKSRARAELALALSLLESGHDPSPRLRGLVDEGKLIRAVQRVQTPGSYRTQALSEIHELAGSLGVEAWVPRWGARGSVQECTSLLQRREWSDALVLSEELLGIDSQESESDPERRARAQAALRPFPQLLAALEESLDQAGVQAFEEARAWAVARPERLVEPPAVVRALRTLGALAWRVECLAGRPPRLPLLQACFADPSRMRELYIPTKHHRQFQYEFLAPRGGPQRVVCLGFLPVLSRILEEAPREHTPSLAALVADQLLRIDQSILVKRGDELLTLAGPGSREASIVNEDLGSAHQYLALEGDPGEERNLKLARGYFERAEHPGHPNESEVLYQLAVVAMRQHDPRTATGAFARLHRVTQVPQGEDDDWDGRRLYVLTDTTTLLARTALDSPGFTARAEIAAEAGRRYLRLAPPESTTARSRSRDWHDGTQILRAGLALLIVGDPEAAAVLKEAQAKARQGFVGHEILRGLIEGRGSKLVAWAMLRNEHKVDAETPYSE